MLGVPSVVLDPCRHEDRILFGEEAFFVRSVWKIDDEKPRGNGNELYDQALNDLHLFSSTHGLRPESLTNIHCQPSQMLNLSSCTRPYARMFDNPPTLSEKR